MGQGVVLVVGGLKPVQTRHNGLHLTQWMVACCRKIENFLSLCSHSPRSNPQPSASSQNERLVVTVLAFNSDDPSSNPAKAYIIFDKFCYKKNNNKQKAVRGCVGGEVVSDGAFTLTIRI